jgi:hypothetical protein
MDGMHLFFSALPARSPSILSFSNGDIRTMRSRKMIRSQRPLVAALLVAAGTVYAGAQAQSAAGNDGGQKSTGKHHVLPANKDTVQWGWLDPTEKPKVVVDSGDIVSIRR